MCVCLVWGLGFFFFSFFSLFLRNLFRLGALGSVSQPSLEGHCSNLNDYCIVGGQLTRDCQWLGTPAPAGPQAAVREEGVKRTGQWGLSCPLSQTSQWPRSAQVLSPPPPRAAGWGATFPYIPAAPNSGPPGVTVNTSLLPLGHLHPSPLEFLKPGAAAYRLQSNKNSLGPTVNMVSNPPPSWKVSQGLVNGTWGCLEPYLVPCIRGTKSLCFGKNTEQ